VGVGLRRCKTENPRRWLERGRTRPCPHYEQSKKKQRDEEQSKVFLWQHKGIPDAVIVGEEAETLHVRWKPGTQGRSTAPENGYVARS
jgi:hypothetical protein